LPLAASGDQSATGDIAPEVARLVKEIPPEALAALGLEPAKRDEKQKKLVGEHREKLAALSLALASSEERGQFEEWARSLAGFKDKYPAPLAKGYVWYEEGPTAEASRVFGRGDPRSPGVEVDPGVPAILVDEPLPAPVPTPRSTGRRLRLARWLAQGDHPLTARVMVNRLWQHHFGEGIVATENDFGVMGVPPSNQALLDWLASELVSGGWRMKRMHRMIVLSSTYQMASTSSEAAAAVDPDCKLLWRYPPRRMEAEALR
jgi:hypothetical protein